MANQHEIRQKITHQIVEALSSGNLPPWRRPWALDHNAGGPCNVVSKKRYSGVNPLLLQIAAHRHGLQSKWWATFKQWAEMGGSVMKRPAHVPERQWGTQIVYCSSITKKKDTDEEKTEKFFLLKTYTVFNVDQVTGVDYLKVGSSPLESHEVDERFENADSVIAATGAEIRFGGNEAYYCPSSDYIQMPHRQQFSIPEYFETLLHEMMHWTEPAHRLNWDRAKEGYAMGELIAEMGGCFCASELGLPTADNLTNHVAYLKNWLKGMNGDPSFIFKAATQASKAADFVLSFSRQPELEESLV